MPGQCWPSIGSIDPASHKCLVFAGIIYRGPSEHYALKQCCFNVGPPSATLAQHYPSIGSPPRARWGSVLCNLLIIRPQVHVTSTNWFPRLSIPGKINQYLPGSSPDGPSEFLISPGSGFYRFFSGPELFPSVY